MAGHAQPRSSPAGRSRPWGPSLFGPYGVNSSCNLRCSYCDVHEPETYPKGSPNTACPSKGPRRLDHLREECFSIRYIVTLSIDGTRFGEYPVEMKNAQILGRKREKP